MSEGSFNKLILSYKHSQLNNKQNLLTSKKKNLFENISKIDINNNDKSNFFNSNNTNNKEKINSINSSLLNTNSKKKNILLENDEILSEFVNYNLNFENPENENNENKSKTDKNSIEKTPKKETLIFSEDLYEKTLTKEKKNILNLISNKKLNNKGKNFLKKDENINFSLKEVENIKNLSIFNEEIYKKISNDIYEQLFQNYCINSYMQSIKLFRYDLPLNFENVFLSSLNSFNFSQNNNNSINTNENKSFSQSHLRADHSLENNNSSLINSLLPNLTIENIFEGSKIKINKNKNIMIFDNKNQTILEEESCLIINSLQNNNLNLKSSLNEISLDNKMGNFNIQSNLYNVQEQDEEEKQYNEPLKLENIINNILVQNNEIDLDLIINKNEELKNHFKSQNIHLNKHQKIILFYNILQISQKNNYYIYQKNLFDKIYIIN